MTKKLTLAAASICIAASLTSCGGLKALSADNFTVTPSPLEEVGGAVPATINGRFPEKYMKKKAVVSVTPVLRYRGGETFGQTATFQGESVQGNDQEISYKIGGNYTMKASFPYVDAMQQSDLYLTFVAQVGKKSVIVPDVKIAEGVVATSTLLSRTASKATTATAEDAFQYAIAQTQQAQIKYLVNQAKIRTSELRSISVQDFVKVLREIKADGKGYEIDNVEIAAYASPEGRLDFNRRLAEQREGSSKGFVAGQLKNLQLDANVDTRYTAEDWEGFQELVSASNIQDKEVILRVLSMYEDPEQREVQIRNLSAAYKELADEILPELRRARLTLNYNIIGRTDSEIEEQLAADPSKLSVEELLYAATFTDDAAQKKAVYTTTTQLYPSDYRAYNNLAQLALAEGDNTTAATYLQQALAKNPQSAEALANSALLALANGNTSDAETALGKATTASNYAEVLGNLNIAQGNYAAAAKNLAGSATNSAALAQILNKDYAAAAKTLAGVKNADATTSYLEAVLAARTNQSSNAIAALKKAIAADSSLKTRAASDLEFSKLLSNADFLSLIK